MRRNRNLIIVLPVLAGASASTVVSAAASEEADLPRVFCLNPKYLVDVKARVARDDPGLKPALDKLLAEADAACKLEPASVMDKDLLPPSGDKHDYISFGTYWWPNPKTKDGLPYIRRDGKVNQETRKQSDSPRFWRTVRSVGTLALAYYLTEKDVYAEKAATLLRVWFLDPKTRMNPHLEFAQGIPGRCKGRSTGIIDTRCLSDLVDAIGLLAGSAAWTPKDQKGMVDWCAAYLQWLRTSKNGRQVDRARNNIGMWFSVQAASLSLFVGQEDAARKILSGVAEKRFDPQIDPDGRMPHELRRTKSFGYSKFNVTAMFTLATLAEKLGIDLWHWKAEDGASLRKAFDYLAQYADGKKKWPHPMLKRGGRQGLFPLLRRAALAYEDDRYERLISTLPDQKAIRRDRTQLLWPEP